MSNTTYYLVTPTTQFVDSNGKPIVGGKVYVYKHNSTILANVYIDFDGTSNTNPVILDSMGRGIFITTADTSYDVEIHDSNDTLLYSVNNMRCYITEAEGAIYTAGDNITISPDNVISATDTKYTAGDNITISSDNVISATGGLSSIITNSTLTGNGTSSNPLGTSIITAGTGTNSAKIGASSNTASGNWSFALGYSTKANGAYSIAGGKSSTVYGEYSIAVGNSTYVGTASAPAVSSVVFGANNKAYVNYSLISGYWNQTGPTYGSASMICGNNNSTAGDNSFISGVGNVISTGSNSAIVGGFYNSCSTSNQVILGGTYSKSTSDASIISGIGTSDSDRTNGFEVSKSGSVRSRGLESLNTDLGSTTPSFVGQTYKDSTTNKLYYATGTSSSDDWTLIGSTTFTSVSDIQIVTELPTTPVSNVLYLIAEE